MADLNFDQGRFALAVDLFNQAVLGVSPTEASLAWARLGVPWELVERYVYDANEAISHAIDQHNRGVDVALPLSIEGIVFASIAAGAIAARLHLGAAA